jgi:hypothetical protein
MALNVGLERRSNDYICRKDQCIGGIISVAPAARRLLAISWSFKIAGKMPALLKVAPALVRHNSEPIRYQLFLARSFTLHTHPGLTPLAEKRRVPLLQFGAFTME